MEKTNADIDAILDEIIPINVIWDEVLFVPIIGVLDTQKAQVLMETMLEKITEQEARVIILDILGVAAADTAIAQHILDITKASRLLGCSTVISGISPSVAQTIVSLGVDLSGVTTTARLKDAVKYAFGVLGMTINTAE